MNHSKHRQNKRVGIGQRFMYSLFASHWSIELPEEEVCDATKVKL